MKALKVEETTGAASFIGSSSDLLPEILIHLPARVLLRLKLVSKQWMSLISDRQFAIQHSRNAYNSNSRTPCGGVFLYYGRRHRRLETNSVPLFGNPPGSVPPLSFLNQIPLRFTFDRVIRSCNGLLLCLFCKHGNFKFDFESRCVVCNPTTRAFKILPMPPDFGEKDWFEGLTLVFNPSKSHHYEVLGMKRFYRMDRSEIHIYSSKTNCWKFQCLIDLLDRNTILCQGVFSNGIVYWMGMEHMYFYDIKYEEFGSLSIPVNFNWMAHYFAESCGRLYLAVYLDRYLYDYNRPCHEYQVFEFDHSSKKWLDPQREILNSHHLGRNKMPEFIALLAVVKGNGNDSDLELLFATCKRLIRFNLLYRQAETLEVSKPARFMACEYIQSLAPV